MTEEARGHRFSEYLTGVAAFGLSESVAIEESWEIAPTSSVSRLPNLVPINPAERSNVTAPLGFGKTHLLLELCRAASQLHKHSGAPSEALVNSVALRLFKVNQGGSMATQQPSTADEQSLFQQIIWHITTAFHLRHRVKLASRLSELQKAVQEEQDGQTISLSSMQSFFQFIEAYPGLRYPNITVIPDRTIYASWKSGLDRVFSIHFLSGGEIRFVIFSPNPKHPGRTIRTSGTATVDVIMSIAAPHGVLDWASQ